MLTTGASGATHPLLARRNYIGNATDIGELADTGHWIAPVAARRGAPAGGDVRVARARAGQAPVTRADNGYCAAGYSPAATANVSPAARDGRAAAASGSRARGDRSEAAASGSRAAGDGPEAAATGSREAGGRRAVAANGSRAAGAAPAVASIGSRAAAAGISTPAGGRRDGH